MTLNVIFNPVDHEELYFTGKNTVIIDVLRATSTIVAALDNGAKEIIPVATVEFAVKLSGGMFGGLTLLCGERNTKKVEGFALGNSPLEFAPDIVKGKSLVLYTTNGSKAIVKARYSENLLLCSFLNISAVAKKIISLDADTEILCAGNSANFSIEDAVCAGRLVSEIRKINSKVTFRDSAKASAALNDTLGTDLKKMMTESEHGRTLIANGFEQDVSYCCSLNTSDSVPFFSGNVIKL